MKSKEILIILFISVLYLVGCSKEAEISEDIGHNIIGEVVQIEKGRFLVVDEERVDNLKFGLLLMKH